MLLFSKPENIKDRMNFGGRELSALESPSGVSIAAGSVFWAPLDWYEPRSHWDWLTVVDNKGIGQRFEIPQVLTDAVARMVELYGPCDGPYAMEIVDGEAFAKAAALYDVEYIGTYDEDGDQVDQDDKDGDADEDGDDDGQEPAADTDEADADDEEPVVKRRGRPRKAK